ncbi:unnamed protein product [Ilex paraguariensis]|uniref:Uncharacterized protein n=1 Tax=Ilex paraguariensis TaxID=185542 RepID=A0ABC8QTG7_9AQUA
MNNQVSLSQLLRRIHFMQFVIVYGKLRTQFPRSRYHGEHPSCMKQEIHFVPYSVSVQVRGTDREHPLQLPTAYPTHQPKPQPSRAIAQLLFDQIDLLASKESSPLMVEGLVGVLGMLLGVTIDALGPCHGLGH